LMHTTCIIGREPMFHITIGSQHRQGACEK